MAIPKEMRLELEEMAGAFRVEGKKQRLWTRASLNRIGDDS